MREGKACDEAAEARVKELVDKSVNARGEIDKAAKAKIADDPAVVRGAAKDLSCQTKALGGIKTDLDSAVKTLRESLKDTGTGEGSSEANEGGQASGGQVNSAQPQGSKAQAPAKSNGRTGGAPTRSGGQAPARDGNGNTGARGANSGRGSAGGNGGGGSTSTGKNVDGSPGYHGRTEDGGFIYGKDENGNYPEEMCGYGDEFGNTWTGPCD